MSDFASLFDLVDTHAAVLSLVVLVLLLIGFARERIPPSAVAVIGAAAFLFLGFVDEQEALSVFGNSAAIAIGAMLILTAALVRTGVLEALAKRVLLIAKINPLLAVLTLLIVAAAASAFINSTPVVVILIPLMVTLAASVRIGAKRLLIPLSYIAILGGTCTLIGTSTNLVINSLARELGQPGFGVFDISVVGLIVGTCGAAFLFLTGRFLLPEDASGSSQTPVNRPNIITEMHVEQDFAGLGESYEGLTVLNHRGISIVSVHRSRQRMSLDADLLAEAGDRVVLRVTPRELATLGTIEGVDLGVRVLRARHDTDAEPEVARVTMVAGSSMVGGRLTDANFMSRFPVAVLGVRRQRTLAGPDLSALTIKAGDELWLKGSGESLEQVATDDYVVMSTVPVEKPFRRERAVLAVGTLIGVVAIAASGLASLAVAAIVGIGLLLLMRSLDASDAWEALNADVLVLIYGMLIIGIGLQNTGAVDLLITLIYPVLQQASPLMILFIIYFLTSVLTETVTNNAVAVIMTPLVIKLAEQLQTDPTALIVTVMFGASASFATPVGYQTNTLVHIAGNYRFMEFLKVGVPMNIVVGIASCFTINWWFN